MVCTRVPQFRCREGSASQPLWVLVITKPSSVRAPVICKASWAHLSPVIPHAQSFRSITERASANTVSEISGSGVMRSVFPVPDLPVPERWDGGASFRYK